MASVMLWWNITWGFVRVRRTQQELPQVSRYGPGQAYTLHVDDDPGANGLPALGRVQPSARLPFC